VFTPRVFYGPWSPSSATIRTPPAEVRVEPSKYSSQDIFVQAGCQRGFLHIQTAVELAQTLLTAVEEMLPKLEPTYVLVVTDPKGEPHYYEGVGRLTSIAGQWTLYNMDEGVLTGPHSNESGWAFILKPDPRIEALHNIINARKEVKITVPQAGEPEPTA